MPRHTPDASKPAREQRFWLGLLYASVAGYLAVSVSCVGYIALTWSQPNRGWLLAVAFAGALTAVGTFLLRHRAIRGSDPNRIFAALNFAAFALIAIACAIDGGFASPMASLLILPMLYLAIGYRRNTVVICGGLGLALVALLVWVSTQPIGSATLLLQSMTLWIGFVLAVMGATTRDRKDAELEKLRQRLETMAATDELTGCLNRRAFTTALTREVGRSSRYGHTVSLLVVDIDNFKRINDRHGHMMGDEILRQFGAVLRATARDADIAGRPGGDELTLLAPETSKEDAKLMAERLRTRVKSHPFPVAITLSIGVCATAPDMEQAATLMRRADRALYAAKRRGRDQIAVCDELGDDDDEPEPGWASVS